MDINSLENAANPNDSEATYRALRDSILQIYQFGTKIAKEANPDNELQVSWELGDTSLMNWISDTHCYLSRKGQKLQFLARPSKLEIISFNLDEGDKLLICSDSLRQNLSDNEIDDILQQSNSSETACQNLLKIASVNSVPAENTHNIVVMEVINNQKVITPTPIADSKQNVKSGGSKMKPIWFVLPLLLLVLCGGIYWLLKNNNVDISKMLGFAKSNVVMEDTLTFINKDSINNTTDGFSKEVDSLKTDVVTPEHKDDFATNSVKEPKIETEIKKPILEETKKVEPKNIPKVEVNESAKKIVKTEVKVSPKKVVAKSVVKSKSTTPEKSPSTISSNSQFDPIREQQNYQALLQQKEKWLVIKNDFQSSINSGNTAATEKFRNSQNVLDRIEQKLHESAKKLGKE